MRKVQSRKPKVVVDLLSKKDSAFMTRRLKSKNHFKNRYYERYGFRLKEYLYQELKTKINGARLIESGDEPHRNIYAIKWNNTEIYVVYDKRLREFVTLLEPKRKYLK